MCSKAADPDASLASWAVRYAASLDGVMVVLSGMSDVEQMEDNLSYMKDFSPLSEEEREVVAKAQQVMASIPLIPLSPPAITAPRSVPMPSASPAPLRP